MRDFPLGRIVLCALVLPIAAHATSYYLVTTGQATANTQLDQDHERIWNFAPSWDWVIGGGKFQIKKGTNTTVDAVLTLHVGDPTGAALATVAVSPELVSTSYGPVSFFFLSPVTLSSGSSYSLVLTSATPTNGSSQYFIKGNDNDFGDYAFQDAGGGALPTTDPSAAPGSTETPEPATLLLSGMTLIGASVWWRRSNVKAEAVSQPSRQ